MPIASNNGYLGTMFYDIANKYGTSFYDITNAVVSPRSKGDGWIYQMYGWDGAAWQRACILRDEGGSSSYSSDSTPGNYSKLKITVEPIGAEHINIFSGDTFLLTFRDSADEYNFNIIVALPEIKNSMATHTFYVGENGLSYSDESLEMEYLLSCIGIQFLDESPAIEIEAENQISSENIMTDNIMMKRAESLEFSCYARPNISAYLLSFILGQDVIAGGSDPYTHTITRKDCGRGYMMFERGLDSTLQQRLYNCKIASVGISGTAGNPIKFTVNGEALNVVLRTTALSAAYETSRPFYFYDGSGRFSYAGATISTINSFNINISVDSLGGLQNGEYETVDLPDFSFDVSVELGFVPDTFTNWKNIAYGGGTTRSETIYTAALDFDFQYTEGAADRQLKIAIPSVAYKSIEGFTMSAGGSTYNETIAGVARKLPTTEMITCTIKNNLVYDLI